MSAEDLSTIFEEDYKAKEEARKARLQAMLSEVAEIQQARPQIAIQPNQPTQQQQAPQGHSLGAHLGEIPKAIASGAGKAVSNTAEALDELWDMGGKYWEDLHALAPDVPFSNESSMQIPEADLETGTGKITESVAQFLTAFIPASKAVKAVGTSAKFLSGLSNPVAGAMTAGGVADYAAFDPTEARLATAIQGLAPEVKMPLLSYLASTDPEDTIEGRLKNVVEGAGLGVMGEMLFRAAKGLKGSIGKKPEGVEEVARPEKTLDDALGEMKKAKDAEMSAREKYDHSQFFARPDEAIVEDVAERIAKGESWEDLRPMFNWDYIDSPDRVKSIINSLNEHLPGMLKAKGFKMHKGWDESVAGAEKYLKDNGLESAVFLKKSLDGVKELDTAIVLAKELHVASSHRMAELAEGISSGTASRHDLLRFKRQMGFHAEIQASVKGLSSSVGRALNAHKMFRDGTMIDDDFLDLAMNSAGGDDVIRKAAKKYLTLSDPRAKNKFVEKSFFEKTVEGVQFWWINSLLSGPTTQMINLISNAGVAAMNVLETGVAAGKNAVRGQGEIRGEDFVAQVTGMWSGMVDSLKISAEAMKAMGEITTRGKVADKMNILKDPEHVGSVYQAAVRRVSTIDPSNSHKLDYDIEPDMQGLFGKVGKFLEPVISSPTRALMAGDEFFKTVHYRGYLHMLASQAARKAGIKDAVERARFIDEFMKPENIKATQVKDALEFAKKGTFQNDLGKTGRHLQGIVQTQPLMRFVLPFIRTPVNIIKYAVHHSPLMAHPTLRKISSQMSDDIAAGGVKRELAEAKVATGTMLFAVASLLAYNGTLTNGTEESMQYGGTGELVGMQRYSWKIGDKYYSFERTDPFGLFFGVTADLVDLARKVDEREWSETAGAALAVLSNNLTNKTYLKGLIDFTDAMMNTEGTSAKKAERFIANFTGSFVPNAFNQMNRIMSDQEIKEMNTFMDYVMKRIPGMTKDMHPKRDLLNGQPVSYKDGLMGGFVPIMVSEQSDDPLRNELHRIGHKPGKLNKGFTYKRVQMELDGAEYDHLQVLAASEVKIGGKTQEQFLNWLITTPYYKSLPDNLDDTSLETKSRLISKTMSRFRNAAKNQLFRESPSIQAKYKEQLQEVKNQQLLKRGN